MRPTESWLPIAQTLGFDSEEEMLKHMYVAQGFSLGTMSEILGFTEFAIVARLRRLKVPIRRRGGPNNRQKSRLAELPDGDLFGMPARHTALAYSVHICTVFNERRRRRALLSNNANEGDACVRTQNEASHGSGSISDE